MILRKLSQLSKSPLNNQKTLQNHPVIRKMTEEQYLSIKIAITFPNAMVDFAVHKMIFFFVQAL